MPAETVVFGTVFMDCKGFAAYRYDPLGRNVGSVRFIHGGVGRNVAEDLASIGAKVSFVSSVDDSALGLEVLNRLKNEGLDVGHVRRAPSSAAAKASPASSAPAPTRAGAAAARS